VEDAARQATAWEMIVDLGNAERQRACPARSAFQMGNSKPQIGKPVLLPGMLHIPCQIGFALRMFLLCSRLPLSQLVAEACEL
jgi:hypothetical protein